MRFEVGNPVPLEHKPDTFEVEAMAMSGDADAYEKVIIGPFIAGQDEDALESLLGTLQRMKDKYPHGRGGNWEKYNFEGVEGFNSWFGTSSADNETEYRTNYAYSSVPYEDFKRHKDLADRIGYFEWPWDVTIQDGLEADASSWKVFYYSSALLKYEVAVLDD